MDSSGQTISTVEINIGRDVGELARILKTALPDSDVVPRTVEDTIILTGSVASVALIPTPHDDHQPFDCSSTRAAPRLEHR